MTGQDARKRGELVHGTSVGVRTNQVRSLRITQHLLRGGEPAVYSDANMHHVSRVRAG